MIDANGNYHGATAKSHEDQHALAIMPSDPDMILVGNDGGLYKSVNGGRTFESLNATISLSQFVSLVLHPTDPLLMYGGTQDNGNQRRNSDNGSWRQYATGDGGACVINPLDPSIVFATYYNGTIWKYRNDTLTFERTVATNSTFRESNSSPRMAFYPPFTGNGVDSTLYFGTWRLFVSTDLGSTWIAPAGSTDLTKGGSDVLSAMAVSRSNNRVIYTGSAQGMVMVSGDAGITWTSSAAGLPNRFVTHITVDNADPAAAYVTFSGYGSPHVYKTTDSGKTWKNTSANLPDVPVNTLYLQFRHWKRQADEKNSSRR